MTILSKEQIEEMRNAAKAYKYLLCDRALLAAHINALIESHEELRTQKDAMFGSLRKEIVMLKGRIKEWEDKEVRRASCCEDNERQLKEARAEIERLNKI